MLIVVDTIIITIHFHAGILLFSDADLQHAMYWCQDKSPEDADALLKSFNEVWRSVIIHCKNTVLATLLYF